MSYETGVRWKVLPFAVLGFVLVTWIVFEAFGLFDLNGMVERIRAVDPATTAAVIFALLVVDVLIPVPSTPLIALAGTALGVPVGVALAVAGSMGSSAAAYALGRFARPWLVNRVVSPDELTDMHRWWHTYGPWLYGVARGVPMLAETVGVSAGIGRESFRKFMLYTLVGTVPVCVAYVVAGSRAETAEEIVMISAVGFLAAVGLGYFLRRRLR